MLDQDILSGLSEVIDPEIGVNIVDLGLIYRAERAAGGIEVAMTLTTPTCPMGESLVEEVRSTLAARFPDAPAVAVTLVWEPAWSPARITEAGQVQLGWAAPQRSNFGLPRLNIGWAR